MCCGRTNNTKPQTPNLVQAAKEKKEAEAVNQQAVKQLGTVEDVNNQIRKDIIARKKYNLPAR